MTDRATGPGRAGRRGAGRCPGEAGTVAVEPGVGAVPCISSADGVQRATDRPLIDPLAVPSTITITITETKKYQITTTTRQLSKLSTCRLFVCVCVCAFFSFFLLFS